MRAGRPRFWLKLSAVLWLLIGITPLFAQSQRAERVKPPFPSIRLSRHFHNEEAIQALGSNLPAVASWYGKSAEEMSRLLRHDRGRRLGGFLLDGGLWRRLRGGPGLRLRLRRSSLRGSRFPRGSRRPGRDLRRRPGNLRRNCLAGLGRLDRRFLHGHLELPDPMEDAGLYRPHAVGLPVREGSCRAVAAGSRATARNAVARGGFF